ncbi:rhamnogalacturonan I rhamnosyltransferase 1-like [Lycium barbarum]|uniref:rhamnogalacturonan I rhamnosyltransferase 1-like n=1 Tax=Lycium barbarum TaxID=112863 RepID=UPI00293EFB9E|nr:rhamnogalacturonan I rhamnosyltransferase 1-like [Lycium barbarum]
MELKLFRNRKRGKLKGLTAKTRATISRLWLLVTLFMVVFSIVKLILFVHTWKHEVSNPKDHPHHGTSLHPKSEYNSNGYLMISTNGGLNQMRAGICDMVAIARYMNATLVVPKFDRTSLWKDQSEFEDVFDVDYFINSLKDEVRIIKELPLQFYKKMKDDVKKEYCISFPPGSWSTMEFYHKRVLPLMKKHEVLNFTKSDFRLANNELPIQVQKLRCRVNYDAMRFVSPINKLGEKIVDLLRQRGPILALHLRYEKDILAFTGCNEGVTPHEALYLQKMRDNISWWKNKHPNSTAERLAGSCPLTPEETALILKALNIHPNTQIYVAAGDTYGGDRRLAILQEAFPNLVRKENLLPSTEFLAFKNHSTQMAAVDYIVSVSSDIFFPTYGGNMAHVVEGHRRYMGFQKTIKPNRKLLVKLIDKYRRGALSWQEFAILVKECHKNRVGNPAKRVVIPGKPKEEEYFWSNPQECL